MWDNYLLYMVFLGQVLVLSFYFPRKILGEITKSMQQHPRAVYPKLYPIEDKSIKTKLKTFTFINALVVIIGLGILAISITNGNDDLLGWDDKAVLVSFLMLQYLPMLYFGVQSFTYLKLMRKKSESEDRSANLQPRKFLNFVSKPLITTAISSYFLCVLTVIYFVQNPFDGFAGLVNILGVTVIYAGLAFGIYQKLYGKKRNPLQTSEDRSIETIVVIKLLVLTAICSSLYLSISLILASMDLRDLGNVIYSLYLQIFIIYTYQVMKFGQVDYSVYKA
jgi:peptidoglycan/LPS O-acetylase OafA/YrhL